MLFLPIIHNLTSNPMASDLMTAPTKTTLPTEQLLQMHRMMRRARLLEERLIYMCKQHHGYFWIGGPGEEAFNTALGLQIKKGQGLDYDFLHFHYRSCPILLAMGMNPIDAIRQMKNTATDRHSGGRNFSSHYSIREWNLTPITSPIETQYLTAIGTGLAQKQHGGDAITIVNGGDAGTAEGDFASCLVWSSRPKQELPMLIIVTNNKWGISTAAHTQHGEHHIANRGKAFGMKTMVVNGNDVEESFAAIAEAMHYVRTERKPLLLEAFVSRLYGHSSASGANFQSHEEDPIVTLEQKLLAIGALSQTDIENISKEYEQEFRELFEQVITEPQPSGDTIYDHTYWQQTGKYW